MEAHQVKAALKHRAEEVCEHLLPGGRVKNGWSEFTEVTVAPFRTPPTQSPVNAPSEATPSGWRFPTVEEFVSGFLVLVVLGGLVECAVK